MRTTPTPQDPGETIETSPRTHSTCCCNSTIWFGNDNIKIKGQEKGLIPCIVSLETLPYFHSCSAHNLLGKSYLIRWNEKKADIK